MEPSRRRLSVADHRVVRRRVSLNRRSTPVPVPAVGYAAAAWCLAFAGVSGWQVTADLTGPPDPRQRYAAYASGLAVLGVLVGLLKLAGAAVALAAVLVPPGLAGRPRQLLGIALRGAAAAGAAAGGGARDPGLVRPAAHLTGCGWADTAGTSSSSLRAGRRRPGIDQLDEHAAALAERLQGLLAASDGLV
jgi:hypothetical protein